MKKFIFISFIFTMILMCFPICYANTFYDIMDTKYEGIVESLAFLNVVDGVSEHVFDANKVVTRAEIAKILVVANGYDKYSHLLDAPKAFKDVKSNAWYYDYVNIATACGFIKGYPDGKFYPDREVTYSQAVAMFMRCLGHNYITEDSEFGWDYNYIWRMRDIELNKGIEAFRNDDGAKRGDIAIFIWNMLNKNYWEVIEEEGTGLLTYSDSGKSLLDRVFGKDYKLISGKKLRKLSASLGDVYAHVEGLGEVELRDPLPFTAVGSRVNGVYNKKTKILSCATYDINVEMEHGYKEELEEDGYRLKDAKDKYYFGGTDEHYIFFGVRRDGSESIIDRALILDLDNKILIQSTKIEKGILTINDEIEIKTTDAVLLDGKRIIEWNKLAKKDAILYVGNKIYILANDYRTEDELAEDNKKKQDNLYYISNMTYDVIQEKQYIGITSAEHTSHYVCTVDLKDFKAGDLVFVTIENGKVTKLKKATERDYEDLDIGRKLITDYKGKTYIKGMFGKYLINEDTYICMVYKRYANNSNTVIEKCYIEEITEDELEFVDTEIVNIIVAGNTAKVIYVERETNRFSVFYARVRDVFTEKSKLKIDISPVDEPVKVYETTGLVNCEPGDIISYTLSGKEGAEILKIDEVYRAGVIGYKGDLIVESVNGKEVTLTNGEVFDKSKTVLSVDGKNYKLNKYKVIVTKIRKDEGRWVFSSTNFGELKTAKFVPGDRIAIDELEGVILIYSKYED